MRRPERGRARLLLLLLSCQILLSPPEVDPEDEGGHKEAGGPEDEAGEREGEAAHAESLFCVKL